VKSIALAFSFLLFFSVPSHADDAATFNSMLALAAKGQPEAQYHVGMMYNNGIGTKQDTKQAFEWFQKATAGGDPLGAYKLGCYYDGQGEGVVAANAEEALKYKLIAANEGYSLAQFDSAVLLAQKGDFENAVKLLRLAADQGHDKAFYGLWQSYAAGKGVEKNLPLAYANFKLALIASNAQLDDKAKAVIDDLSAQMSDAEIATAQKIVEEWKPHPTELTLEAQRGITAAEEHLQKAK
jgi:TPR repeat protein